ncbi:MAG: WbqC family protein [Nitrosotalea sp.]
MIVSISQPTLFPWLGYFSIIKNSDVFVFLDNVKFEKRSWQMRNKLKAISGDQESEVWIRIPTRLEKTDTMIKDVLIDNTQDWKRKHINAFRSNYGKDYAEIDFLQKMYEKDWEKLAEFNITFIRECCQFLGIRTKLVRASDLSVEGKKSQLLLNICKNFSATEYLSTVGSKEYLENDKNMFEIENIKISYHEYVHPIYRQKGNTFIEKMSILDLLFNEKENSMKFI